MRRLVLALSFCSSISAGAPARVAAFRSAADRAAAGTQSIVTDFYRADLDSDGRDDLVAEACTEPADEDPCIATLFVESASGRRRALRYSRPFASPLNVAAAAEPRSTKQEMASIDRGYHRVNDETDVALRGGALAVVRQYEGSSHIPSYFEGTEVDWRALVRTFGEGDYVADGQSDDATPRYKSRRREAILLVGDESTPTDTQVIRGRDAWSDAADASLRVHVRRSARRLVVDIALVDDTRIDAAERTGDAVDAADHLSVWIGGHALRLAHDADGWFALGKDAAQARVRADGETIAVDVPRAWARLHASDFASAAAIAPADEEPFDASHAQGAIGSLVVAFADVDAPGGPRTVVSTAPVPRHGEPTGILVELPHAARWLRGTSEVVPWPFR